MDDSGGTASGGGKDDGAGLTALQDQLQMLLENEPDTAAAEKHAEWARAVREVREHLAAEGIAAADEHHGPSPPAALGAHVAHSPYVQPTCTCNIS